MRNLPDVFCCIFFWCQLYVSELPGTHLGPSVSSEGPPGFVGSPSDLEGRSGPDGEAPAPGCNTGSACWGPGLSFGSVRGLVRPRFDSASKVPSGSTIMSITVNPEKENTHNTVKITSKTPVQN